jgi:hypothetical protein
MDRRAMGAAALGAVERLNKRIPLLREMLYGNGGEDAGPSCSHNDGGST